jgi:hypothetical protein
LKSLKGKIEFEIGPEDIEKIRSLDIHDAKGIAIGE